MNHNDAMETMAAERYILGELEPAERDAFEEHFFECTVCADDVRDSAKFAAGVRTSDARVKAPAVGRFNWWAAAASIFAALLGYQSLVVVPQMRMSMHTQTQSAPVMRLAAEAVVLEPQSRGTRVRVKVRRDEAVPFTVAIPNSDPHAIYVCEIHDDANHVRVSVRVPGEEASDPVPMVVAPGVLSSGDYKLVIRGGDREIAAYPFTMEVR
jgi:anti-sigma factor RsiW